MGSMTRWLAHQVGEAGSVVALDIDTRLLETRGLSQIDVVERDVATWDFASPRLFDLVHARALLHHIPQRSGVIDKAIAALRPGGWLVLEEPDLRACLQRPPYQYRIAGRKWELYRHFVDLIHSTMATRGVALGYGARLARSVRLAGMIGVRERRDSIVIHGGSQYARFLQLTYEQTRELVLAADPGGADQIARFLALFDDPEFFCYAPTITRVFAQRPIEPLAIDPGPCQLIEREY